MLTRHPLELEHLQQQISFAGFDEAGRGPLAGPVVAACAILPGNFDIKCLADSKKLSLSQRQKAFELISNSCAHGIGISEVWEINLKNIFQASMLAMAKAYQAMLQKFSSTIEVALVDGHLKSPYLEMRQIPIVKGDATVACIAAASILAKVTRDGMMDQLDRKYPQYGFAKHKGYGTAFHREMLGQHGRCPEHREHFLLKHEKAAHSAVKVEKTVSEKQLQLL